MPDLINEKYDSNFFYFTASCIIEPMHGHLSPDRRERDSAKIWIRRDGSTEIAHRGEVSDRAISDARKAVKHNIDSFSKIWADIAKIDIKDIKYHEDNIIAVMYVDDRNKPSEKPKNRPALYSYNISEYSPDIDKYNGIKRMEADGWEMWEFSQKLFSMTVEECEKFMKTKPKETIM